MKSMSLLFILIGLVVLVGVILVGIHLKNNAQFYNMRKIALILIVAVVLLVLAFLAFMMLTGRGSAGSMEAASVGSFG